MSSWLKKPPSPYGAGILCLKSSTISHANCPTVLVEDKTCICVPTRSITVIDLFDFLGWHQCNQYRQDCMHLEFRALLSYTHALQWEKIVLAARIIVGVRPLEECRDQKRLANGI